MADGHDALCENLFSRYGQYDTDGNRLIDVVGFSNLVKDLMNIRDNVVNHSLKDASALAEMFRAQLGLEESFSIGVLSKLIKSDALLLVGIHITMIHNLAGTRSAQLKRSASNDITIEMLSIETVFRRTVSVSQCDDPSDDQLSPSSGAVDRCLAGCQKEFPSIELYGVSLPCQKKCLCDVKMCLQCLRTWVRHEIQSGVRPACPGSTTSNKRCGKPLDTTLVALLFSNICPLCEKKVKSSDDGTSATLVPCALGHSFCQPCLEERSMASLSALTPTLPCCPRYSECKFVYDADTLRLIFGNRENVEDLILQFHTKRVLMAQDSHPLYKACPTPDCKGYISCLALKEKDSPSKGQCPFCRKNFCIKCMGPFHPHHDCLAAQNISSHWIQFLRSLCYQSQYENEDEESKRYDYDRATSPAVGGLEGGAVLMRFNRDKITSSLTKLEQVAADNDFFRERIEAGLIKKCPKCNRLIEKMKGCDSMLCGNDYHGVSTIVADFL